MHNIKDIRTNLDSFERLISKRNIKIEKNNIIKLDAENRSLIQSKELLEKEKKDISKKKDQNLFEKSKEISKKIEKISTDQSKIKFKLDNILSSLPNLPLDDVPVGMDENSNVEIKKYGELKKFDFNPKSHYEIGNDLNMLDFDLATKTTGSRFVFVKNKLAHLERALSNFMIDTHINKNNYSEISPPLIANENTMFGTGQLPKFENDQFELILDDKNERKFLIPTAEVILTNMVKDKILDIKDLPLRLVASTPCFRKEAGSYGKDTKGMIRQHQFYKVELVSIVEPNSCSNELDRMTNCATDILDQLKLPYRKVYAGGIGYFSSNGDFDTCIALRTAIAKNNKYYVQAGAGIVADSKPIKEYDETVNKAKALISALE